jgi:hypothetical protein
MLALNWADHSRGAADRGGYGGGLETRIQRSPNFQRFHYLSKAPSKHASKSRAHALPLSGFMRSRFQRQFLLLSRHARASVHVETVIAEVMQPEKENGDGKHAPR